jgi:hypothetical protein
MSHDGCRSAASTQGGVIAALVVLTLRRICHFLCPRCSFEITRMPYTLQTLKAGLYLSVAAVIIGHSVFVPLKLQRVRCLIFF